MKEGMAEEVKTFKVTIDNITIDVPAGTTVLQAARMIGGDVAPPAMCYYSKLKGSGGKCRTCLVEISKGRRSEADAEAGSQLQNRGHGRNGSEEYHQRTRH
jgi:NADH-quinone oxidoreductase subunit G